MNFFENITLRRTRTKSLSETTANDVSTNDVSCNNMTLDGTTNSMPNISDDEENDKVQDLLREIGELKSQLLAAHEEINNLSLENSELKQTINNLNKKCQIMKNATLNLSTEIGTPKRNVRLSTPCRKQHSKTDLDLSQNTVQGGCEQGSMSNKVKTTLKFVKETSECHQKNARNSSQLQHKKRNKLCIVSNENSKYSICETPPVTVISPDLKKNKLCILSNIRSRNAVQVIEDTFGQNFTYCHYMFPNSSTERLLNNIDTKLLDFGLDDYCIIMLGEKDLKTSSNCLHMVETITKCLKHIINTNVIVCSPTYILGSPIYNYKVEVFNNLLAKEINSGSYAYYFDTNSYLSFDMFSSVTGTIKNSAIIHIYRKIMEGIKIDIDYYHNSTTLTNLNVNSESIDFFRNSC